MPEKPIQSEQEILDELNSLEAGLGRVSDDLEHLQRLAAIGTLAAGVVHEMRNLLTPAMTYSDLLLSREVDEATRNRILAKIAKGVRQAVDVSDSMLELAAGAHPEKRSADIDLVVRDVLTCLGQRSRASRVQIQTAVEPGTRACIQPLELQQILLNLILNAIRALGDRQGTITIRALTEESGRVKIAVSDTGPGIPDGIRDRLFEPFVTAPPDASSKSTATTAMPSPTEHRQPTGGTGLGLAICRQIIRRNNGSISVDSSRQGTSFVILLDGHSVNQADAA